MTVGISFLNQRQDGDVYRIKVKYAGADSRIALRKRGKLTANEIATILNKLDRMDRASRHGPWTWATLSLIEDHPARRAIELAQEMGLEKPAFKSNVRKLKEMGLTESLEIGYRMSLRGKTVKRALEKSSSLRP